MENGQKHNISIMTKTMMMADNQIVQVSTHDAMARRVKNRERQRRYRARKRLLADLKKAQAIDTSIPPHRNIAADNTCQEQVDRVHCRRDWKKDARKAHILKEQVIRSNSSIISAPTSPSGSSATSFSAGVFIDAPIYNGSNPSAVVLYSNETRKHIPSRRHWKAEARNKKI